MQDLNNRPNQFGNRFILSIHMIHRPSPADLSATPPPFTETPRLEWKEKIIMRDVSAGTFWEWEEELYSFQPGSLTFKAWRQRYVEVFRRTVVSPSDFEALNGSAELLVNGIPVTRDQLLPPPHAPTSTIGSRLRKFLRLGSSDATNQGPPDDLGKAEVVRQFIQSNECELRVKILDRPGIGVNQHSANYQTIHKERVLLFDCGVGGHMVKAHQHLIVDVRAGKHTWRRSSWLGWTDAQLDFKSMRRVIADPQQFEGDMEGYTSCLIYGEFY